MKDVLQALAKNYSELPSRKEVTEAFHEIRRFIVKAIERLEQRIDTRLEQVRGADGKDGRDGKDGKQGPPGKDSTIPGPKGDKGDPGTPADEVRITQDILRRLPPPPSIDPIIVRDKLEVLEGNERLDKSAVKGIEDLEERINSVELRPTSVGGAKGIGLYVDGSKKLLTAQQINLVAGTGITLSYAHANGRNDITITATGTASLTPITVTGTIDDNNTSFTAASTPNLVVVSGRAYRDGHGCTIVGTAITLDDAPGFGADIYAL